MPVYRIYTSSLLVLAFFNISVIRLYNFFYLNRFSLLAQTSLAGVLEVCFALVPLSI